VAAGAAEAGLAGTAAVLNGMEEGLDFVDVMRWMWNQTFPLITSADSGVASVEDLRGKVVGISEAGGGDVPALEAYLRSAGLEPRVDVDLLPVGENVPTIMQAFENGQIAAYSSSWNRNISFRAAGFDLVDLTPESFQQLPAEDVVVPASLAAENPELVAGLCRAIAKGMLVGLEHPETALAIMAKVSPEEHDDTAYAWMYMEGAQETVRPPMRDGKYYFGVFDFDQWQMFADLSGEVEFTLSDYLTNDFVDEINNFDYEQVLAKAAAYADANAYPARPAKEMQQITFLLPFIRTIAFYPVFVADEMGYFAEEGLEVDIQPTDGSSFVVQQVAAGRAEAGLAGTAAVLNGMEEGLDFVDVMRWMWNQTFPLITSADSGVASVEDLRGKVVGISDAAGGDVPALEAYLRSAGLEPRVDVDLLPVGENVPTIMQAFENGQIAAYSSSWNRNISFRAAGFDLVDLTPESFQQLPAEDVVVPASLAEENPELVAGLCRAIAKGMLVGLEHPETALAIMQKVSPEEHDDTAYAWLYMEGAQETVRPPMQDGKYYFGVFDFDQWQTFADLSGEVEFTLSDFLTNDFVDEINNFDYEGVLEEAAAYAAENPYPERP
jgi:NitT/TauT family transport system substrate-binding protein